MLASCIAIAAMAMPAAWARPSGMEARGHVVNHDSLNPTIENLPGTNFGNALRMFKPYMYNRGGCQVYTAIDMDGNWSGGLHDSGSIDGKCGDHSKGQVYARGAQYNGVYGIMYAWYWPKDQPVAGPAGGHRHD